MEPLYTEPLFTVARIDGFEDGLLLHLDDSESLQTAFRLTPVEARNLACHLAAWAMKHGVEVDEETVDAIFEEPHQEGAVS